MPCPRQRRVMIAEHAPQREPPHPAAPPCRPNLRERREAIGMAPDLAECADDTAEQEVAVARIGTVVLVTGIPVEPDPILVRPVRTAIVEIARLDRTRQRRWLAEQLAL